MKSPRMIALCVGALAAALAGYNLIFAADASTPSAPAVGAFENTTSPLTFAEFCRQNPLTGKSLGQTRLVFEALFAEMEAPPTGAATPSVPTDAMLTDGRLIQQRVFANSVAAAENVVSVGRDAKDAATSEPWVGQRLFTCVENAGSAYKLTLAFADSQMEGWVNQTLALGPTRSMPVLGMREMRTSVTLKPDGQWTALGGSRRTVSPPDGGRRQTLQSVLYVRLYTDKAAAALPVSNLDDLQPVTPGPNPAR